MRIETITNDDNETFQAIIPLKGAGPIALCSLDRPVIWLNITGPVTGQDEPFPLLKHEVRELISALRYWLRKQRFADEVEK